MDDVLLLAYIFMGYFGLPVLIGLAIGRIAPAFVCTGVLAVVAMAVVGEGDALWADLAVLTPWYACCGGAGAVLRREVLRRPAPA